MRGVKLFGCSKHLLQEKLLVRLAGVICGVAVCRCEAEASLQMQGNGDPPGSLQPELTFSFPFDSRACGDHCLLMGPG